MRLEILSNSDPPGMITDEMLVSRINNTKQRKSGHLHNCRFFWVRFHCTFANLTLRVDQIMDPFHTRELPQTYPSHTTMNRPYRHLEHLCCPI